MRLAWSCILRELCNALGVELYIAFGVELYSALGVELCILRLGWIRVQCVWRGVGFIIPAGCEQLIRTSLFDRLT